MNLIEVIQAIPAHRHPRGIRHPLGVILTIIFLGSCTGYWGYKHKNCIGHGIPEFGTYLKKLEPLNKDKKS